jgi:hypothetical protein
MARVTRKSNAGSGVPTNPYGITRQEDPNAEPDYYDVSDPAYAAPEETGPYTTAGNPWSEQLQEGIGTTPDAQRERRAPVYSQRVNGSNPRGLWSRLFADRKQREIVETITPLREQIAEQKDARAALGGTRFAPNPRLIPPGETRPTEALSPSSYGGYTRDMSGGTPRLLNGNHFSLADHRRYENEIYGLAPARSLRSSQRLDVLPWGTNVVDQAPQTNYPQELYDAPVSPEYTGRSYRLG